jgi:phosphohistidine phosphatase
MRKIIFLRHGKTEDISSDIVDHKRELLPQGLEDAKKIGDSLKDVELELILSSSAIRASQTAHVFAESIMYPTEQIAIMDELYNPSLNQLLDVVRGIDNKYNFIMVVGHNPGFSDCCNLLCGVNNISLSTCNYCIIELNCDWADIQQSCGKLLIQGSP